MPTNFAAFSKIEGLPAAGADALRNAAGRLLVIVKLNKGASVPSYVTPRATLGPDIFTAEIDEAQFPQLAADPAVMSVEPSKAEQLIR